MENPQEPIPDPGGFGYLRELGYPGWWDEQRLLAEFSFPPFNTSAKMLFGAYSDLRVS